MEVIIIAAAAILVSIIVYGIATIKLWIACRKKDFLGVIKCYATAITPSRDCKALIHKSADSVRFFVNGICVVAVKGGENGSSDSLRFPNVILIPGEHGDFVEQLRQMPLPVGISMDIIFEPADGVWELTLIENVELSYKHGVYKEIIGFLSILQALLYEIVQRHRLYINTLVAQSFSEKARQHSQTVAPLMATTYDSEGRNIGHRQLVIPNEEEVEAELARKQKRTRNQIIVASGVALLIIAAFIGNSLYENRTVTYKIRTGNDEFVELKSVRFETWQVGDVPEIYDDILIEGVSIHPGGKVVDPIAPNQQLDERHIFVHRTGGWGIVDPSGEILVPTIIPGKIMAFRSNLILVRYNGKFGIYDKNGNQLLPFEYDKIDFNSLTDPAIRKGKAVRLRWREEMLNLEDNGKLSISF